MTTEAPSVEVVPEQGRTVSVGSGRLVRRGGRVRYQGRWVSSHWYNRYVGKIFSGQPVPKVRKKRVPRRALEMAWLKQELDAAVARGELTCDSSRRYGLPEWNTPNTEGSRGA